MAKVKEGSSLSGESDSKSTGIPLHFNVAKERRASGVERLEVGLPEVSKNCGMQGLYIHNMKTTLSTKRKVLVRRTGYGKCRQ